MKIMDLPKHLRPREKLIGKGAQNVKDSELLAILLRTGTSKKNAIEMSEYILSKYSKKVLSELSYQSLINIDGIDSGKACTILAAFELTKRVLELSKSQLPLINNPADAVTVISEISSYKKEHFMALFLNARNQLLYKETVSIGTLTASLVHPREVFEPALRYSAASVLVAHNHPSGDTTPSEQDISITKRLMESGKLLGIDLVDHLIISSTGYTSLKEEGIM